MQSGYGSVTVECGEVEESLPTFKREQEHAIGREGGRGEGGREGERKGGGKREGGEYTNELWWDNVPSLTN